MPTVSTIGPFRFFFSSSDGSESPHVHVQHERKVAKFWLDPVAQADSDQTSRSSVLADGRTIIVPLKWYPRLLNATAQQRATYELLGDGEYVHWPQIDEDLTVSGLLRGTPAPNKRGG